MKLVIHLLILSILISCGGGSTGDITVNGGINILNDSDNNNINNDNSQEGSPSELALSILYNPSNATASEKGFIRSAKNTPAPSFSSTQIVFASDVPGAEQTKAQQALSSAAEIFGFLDIHYFGLGSNAVPYETLKSSACNIFGYVDCDSNNMTSLNAVVSNGTSASGVFLIGIDSAAQPAHLIYQGTTPSVDQIKTIHEYARVYQNAVSLGMSGAPAWFKEGLAQYLAQWLARERGFVAGTFVNHMDSMWDQAFANRSVHSLQDQEIYKDTNNPLGFDAEKYGQALWAIAYMTELANQRAGVTNGSQVALVDLVTQIRTKGWELAFTDNIGVTTANFYTDFANVLNANDKSSRLANLVTTNIGSTIVPQYNYSTLQVTGASATSNYGGNPVSAKRSVYFFNTDAGTVPTYNGSFWPYVKSSTSSTITQEEGISALLAIQTSNYVTINSLVSSPRPVYQYVSDSDATASGSSISGWAAINFDGNPVISRTTYNMPPAFATQASIAVNENQTAVTTLSAIDNDLNESLFFTLSGTDANYFNLSNSGTLSFKSAPNFEDKNQYELILLVNDGEEIVSQATTINIQDTNDPPFINGLASSIGYLETSGADVLTIPALDPDAGANLSYSLGGADAAALSVSNSGVITFNAPPIFETKAIYNITISVSDGMETASQALTINIQNTNTPPSFNNFSNVVSFNENSSGTVTTISATDNDSGANLIFSLGGPDASALSISNSGEITFNSPPDYEAKNQYVITVTASDGIESASQTLNINIQDINDSPTINGLVSPISFLENSLSDIVTVNASDQDASANLTYSLSGPDATSTDPSQISLLISDTGVITFSSPPDYEGKSTYNLTVSVSDGISTVSQPLTINIQNINEAPSIEGLVISSPSTTIYTDPQSTLYGDISTVSLNENVTENAISIIVSDLDSAESSLIYTLSGADAADMTISNSGNISFNVAPNYETKNQYVINLSISDGVLTTSQPLTINILDVNDGPVINGLASTFSYVENSTADVVTLNVTDEDTALSDLTYSLSGAGADATELSISSTGVITFNSPPDFEVKNQYVIMAIVSDGVNDTGKQFTINIQDANDPPIIGGITSPISKLESLNILEAITTASASDNDPNTVFSYSLGGADASAFTISNSGEIRFIAQPDFETKNAYAIVIELSDGSLSTSLPLDINILNVNEFPVINGLANNISFNENSPTEVVALNATDEDAGSNLTYSLGGADAAALSISSSGIITFNSPPNYEIKNQFDINVAVSDGTNVTNQAVTINIQNLDEPLTINGLASTISYLEGSGSEVVSVNASDDDAGTVLSYSLGGADAAELSISNVGGITFNNPPDFETKNTYSVTVIVSNGNETVNQTLTINIQNINEYPIINGLDSSITFNENATTNVVEVDATDNDAGTVLSYSLSGDDASALSISNTGVITFNSPPDYETKNTYNINVEVSDGIVTTSPALTINIQNLNDPPVINNLANNIYFNENESVDVVTVNATDQDGSNVSFSLSGADASELSISSSGVISFNSVPDFGTKNTYNLNVLVSDGTNSTSQAIVINIQDVNEPPVINYLSTSNVGSTQASVFSYNEGATEDVLTVNASDDDLGTVLTYGLTGGDVASTAHASLLISNTGVISFNYPPDYEVKNSYSDVTIVVSDGTFSVTKDISINIMQIDEPPVINNLSNSISFDENSTADVVTVNASDPDAGSNLTYSLGGADATELSISNTGVITFNSPPDYETKNTYNINVEVSDGTLSTSQAININIVNISESPVINSPANSISYNENATTSVVSVNATDSDEGTVFNYSLSGADASALSISNAGVITFNSSPDFETKNSYSFVIEVSDGQNNTSQAQIINIINVDESPVINGLANNISFDENSTADVVTVNASDPDAGSNLTYSLGGADATELSISNSGIITFNTSPDFETKNTFNVSVSVSDGSNVASQAITINIQDTNDPPVIIGLGNTVNFTEHATALEVVTVNATDNDTLDTLTYSLSGADASALSISNTGIITFNSSPDRELKSQYAIIVSVGDGINETNQALTINIQNLDEIIFINGLANNFLYTEGSTADVVDIGALVTDEFNSCVILNYSLSGQDANAFNISNSSACNAPNNGVLNFNASPDFESKNIYNITVTVTNGNYSVSQNLTINIENIGTDFVGLNSTFSFTENSFEELVKVNSSDPASYSLSGPDAAAFSISNSGIITFNFPPDYETKNTYNFTVSATRDSDGEITSQALTVNIQDVVGGEPLAIEGLAAQINYNENASSDVVTVNVSNVDYVVQFFLEGDDANSFSISNTGVITFNSPPDFEIKSSYSLGVYVCRYLSCNSNNPTQYITINIIDLNESPVIYGLADTIYFNENSTTLVVSVNATDQEGAAITYSISGADAADLSISNIGDITFNAPPVYATKDTYNIIVEVSSGTLVTSQAVIIKINPISSASQFSIQKGSNINGDNPGDRSGAGLDINSAGNIVAIGQGYGVAGPAKTFKYEDGIGWSQFGGSVGSNQFVEVRLSDSGNIMSLSTGDVDGQGRIEVYELIGGTWTARGSVINVNNKHTHTMSGDGSTIIFGWREVLIPKVYKWNGADYVFHSEFGEANVRSLDTNNRGNTIIAGNINDGPRLYSYSTASDSWELDIVENSPGFEGYSVAMSSNGQHFVVGCFQCQNNSGEARVYSTQPSVNSIGNPIIGDLPLGQFGRSVSINDSGTLIAIGSNSAQSGYVKVFSLNGSAWQEVIDIDGESAEDQFGWKVRLSEDGEILAASAIDNDGNGANSGHVKVFD